jgi:quercetin 2,3-dioxygenase
MLVFEDHLERGKVTPMHLHADVDEALYIIEGDILLDVEGSEQVVGTGDSRSRCEARPTPSS